MTGGVFEAGGLLRASSAEALRVFLRRQRGVEDAEANSVSQSVTVHYDEAVLTANDVRALIERFGCKCGGEVVPCHLCRDEQPAVIGSTVPPAAVTAAPHDEHAGHAVAVPAAAPAPAAAHDAHAGHAMAAPAPGAAVQGEMAQMAHAMGHGGGMTMDDMVRDMRNRFIVAFILAIPIFLYCDLASACGIDHDLLTTEDCSEPCPHRAYESLDPGGCHAGSDAGTAIQGTFRSVSLESQRGALQWSA